MKMLIPLATFGALLAVAPTNHPAAAETISVRIDTDDLDLASRRGMAELDRRLRMSVQTLCPPASDTDLHGKNEVRRCRETVRKGIAARRADAIASAVRNRSEPAETPVLVSAAAAKDRR